jgi:hypothetical protein
MNLLRLPESHDRAPPARQSPQPWQIPGPASAELKAAAANLRESVGRPLNFRIDDAELARNLREQAAWAQKPVETFITEKLRDIVRSLDPNSP